VEAQGAGAPRCMAPARHPTRAAVEKPALPTHDTTGEGRYYAAGGAGGDGRARRA